jgi:hypothetical protein
VDERLRASSCRQEPPFRDDRLGWLAPEEAHVHCCQEDSTLTGTGRMRGSPLLPRVTAYAVNVGHASSKFACRLSRRSGRRTAPRRPRSEMRVDVAGTAQDCGGRQHLLVMEQREHDERDGLVQVPAIGDRVEVRRMGVSMRGTVHYADGLQVLVKWDDGSSSSLRVGQDTFAIVEAKRSEARSTENGISTTGFDRIVLSSRDVRLPIEGDC